MKRTKIRKLKTENNENEKSGTEEILNIKNMTKKYASNDVVINCSSYVIHGGSLPIA